MLGVSPGGSSGEAEKPRLRPSSLCTRCRHSSNPGKGFLRIFESKPDVTRQATCCQRRSRQRRQQGRRRWGWKTSRLHRLHWQRCEIPVRVSVKMSLPEMHALPTSPALQHKVRSLDAAERAGYTSSLPRKASQLYASPTLNPKAACSQQAPWAKPTPRWPPKPVGSVFPKPYLKVHGT